MSHSLVGWRLGRETRLPKSSPARSTTPRRTCGASGASSLSWCTASRRTMRRPRCCCSTSSCRRPGSTFRQRRWSRRPAGCVRASVWAHRLTFAHRARLRTMLNTLSAPPASHAPLELHFQAVAQVGPGPHLCRGADAAALFERSHRPEPLRLRRWGDTEENTEGTRRGHGRDAEGTRTWGRAAIEGSSPLMRMRIGCAWKCPTELGRLDLMDGLSDDIDAVRKDAMSESDYELLDRDNVKISQFVDSTRARSPHRPLARLLLLRSDSGLAWHSDSTSAARQAGGVGGWVVPHVGGRNRDRCPGSAGTCTRRHRYSDTNGGHRRNHHHHCDRGDCRDGRDHGADGGPVRALRRRRRRWCRLCDRQVAPDRDAASRGPACSKRHDHVRPKHGPRSR